MRKLSGLEYTTHRLLTASWIALNTDCSLAIWHRAYSAKQITSPLEAKISLVFDWNLEKDTRGYSKKKEKSIHVKWGSCPIGERHCTTTNVWLTGAGIKCLYTVFGNDVESVWWYLQSAGWLPGVRLCKMSVLPANLVQELNIFPGVKWSFA